MKTYARTDVELILEWVDKYFEVSALISNILSFNHQGDPPPNPSFENEIEYQHQRVWFLESHNKFVPIWAEFCASTGNAKEPGSNIEGIEYRENPFLYFYHPDNLSQLVHTMGGTNSTDIWDPERKDIEEILKAIKMFSYTVMQLRYWIGEFAEESSTPHHLYHRWMNG